MQCLAANAVALHSEDVGELCDEELMLLLAAAPDRSTINRLFGEFFERYHRQVARWCLRLCKDPDGALDLAQEVFLKVFRSVRTFRGDAHFSTWLYVITRNHCLNRMKQLKKRQDKQVSDIPLEQVCAIDENLQAELEREQLYQQTLEYMRSALTPVEIRVLVLHHVQGLTLAAITTQLGLSNSSGAKAYVVSASRKLKFLHPSLQPHIAVDRHSKATADPRKAA
jgi:RNA polymerase sigma-70 factor, ECF subfamily